MIPPAGEAIAVESSKAGKVTTLFYLPPHAPDRNPDELAGKHLKAAGHVSVTGRAGLKRKYRKPASRCPVPPKTQAMGEPGCDRYRGN
jgi:hypothetical protein